MANTKPKDAERPVEPTPVSAFEHVAKSGDAFIAALESAAATARAERTRLEAEIAELQAKRAEEQRQYDDLRCMENLEFIERCIKAGIDKKTLAELRAEVLEQRD